MCWHKMLSCGVCSGENCVLVLDQNSKMTKVNPAPPNQFDDCTIHMNLSTAKFLAEEGSTKANTTQWIHTACKSLHQNAHISILFCPTEEELPKFYHSGDYGLFHVASKYHKSAGEEDADTYKCLEVTEYLISRSGTDTNCLLTFNDNPGHQIASMNQVGDFPSEPNSFTNRGNTPELHDLIRNPHDVLTARDISSTFLLNDPHLPTSTTAGLRWTLYEQEDCHEGSFSNPTSAFKSEETDHFRPAVPTRFSLRFSSEGYPLPYPSDSLGGEDVRVGYTSTTHEIRWTQIEQDRTQTTDQNQDPPLPLSVRFNIAPMKYPEMTCCCSQCESVSKLQSDSMISGAPRPITTTTATCEKTLGVRPILTEHSSETASSVTPAHTVTEKSSTLGDNSVALVTEEAPCFTQTLNELSWHGEASDQITHRNISESDSRAANRKHGSTSLIVQHSPIHLPTSFYPESQATSPSEQPKVQCSRCVASAVVKRIIQHKATQTLKKPPNGIPSQTNATLYCLFTRPPIGSEPPAVSFKMRIQQEFKEFILNSCARNSEVFSTSENRALIKLTEKSSFTEVKKSTLSTSEKLAPLRVRQPPLPKPAKFVPFERLRPPAQLPPPRIGKSIQRTEELAHLDVNALNEIFTDETNPRFSSEQEQPNEARDILHCTYVEVLIRRNLESVAPPSCLNSSESRIIYNLLDRTLQNAVATQFMSSIYKYRKTINSALVNHTSITEGGDSEAMAFGKTIMTNESPDSGSIVKAMVSRKSRLLSKGYANSGTFSKRVYGGAYVFTQGPRHIKPPKQWWDHFRQCTVYSEFKSVAAWKLDPVKLIVGGFINYDHHLQIVASSNDGRLGVTYLHAAELIAEICRKGTRYAKRGCLFEPANQAMSALLGDSVRMHFKSPDIARLLACADEDMSSALGVEDLGLGVVALPKQTTFNGRRKWESIMLFTKGDSCANEKDRIHQMITGVKRLRALAVELTKQTSCAVKRDIQPVESVDYLVRMTNQSSSQILNYTKRYLNNSLVSDLRNKTTFYDGTLAHCIRTTAYCPTYLYPKASDPEAYKVYESFFEPILRDINLGARVKHHPLPNYQLPTTYPSKMVLPNVISYRIRFVRNISGFGFPPVMTLNDYLAVEKICKDALLSWTEEGKGSWYSLSDIQEQHPAAYANLIKKNLLMPRRLPCRKVSGVYRFWPEGRAIYVAPNHHRDCDMVVQINGEDHLKVICVDWSGKQPSLAYTRASKLMMWLDSRICFSRINKWGFLSPIPWNVGTGMQVGALIKCPYFGKDTDLIDRICAKVQLMVRSNFSQGVPVLQHVFDIVLQSTFGRTESDLMVSFLRALTKICRGCAKPVG